MPVFEVTHLSRRFDTGRKKILALKYISLLIDPGRLTIFMGASGSGKTTLLHILGLLDPEYEGGLLFVGNVVKNLSDRARAQKRLTDIGFVFQNLNLLPNLTVQGNVALPHWHLHGNRGKALKKGAELLGEMGLEDKLDRFPRHLSAGELQRAAVARALVNDPAVLIADEPTAHLNETATHLMGRIFLSLAKEGRTVIVASHDTALEHYADQIMNLSFGTLAESGSPQGDEI